MKSRYGLAVVVCWLASSAVSGEELLVQHRDDLTIDPKMTLRQVVEATYGKYPQAALADAYASEVSALDRRSASWVAGYPQIYLQWIDDRILNDRGLVEVQTGYQVPFWMWGQRDASRKVADEARDNVESFVAALKLEVAGQVRDSLWQLRLVENRLGLAKQIFDVAQQLTAVVQRRVELGDLARADLLLSESDQLEKKTALVQAEAEVMHARKAYQSLTRLARAPVEFAEKQSGAKAVDDHHPAIAAANGLIERAQAEVEYVRLSKQGNQPSILVGTQHDRGTRRESFNNSANLVLQVPIGGDDYNAPFVAQAETTVTSRMADRDALVRQLERALHEAEHNLEVDRVALEIANRRREIADAQLKMSKLAFETGEISLIDFLKIQSGAQAAIRDAAERGILLQKDTATFNQVLGVMP